MNDRVLIPNSFQTPNAIVDLWLPKLNPADAKLLLFLCRKTFGYHKREDRISLGQFVKGTGLSRSRVNERLRALQEAGLLSKTADPGGSVWALNLDANADEVSKRLRSDDRTSTIVELVVPSNQNRSDDRTSASTTIEPTKTQSLNWQMQ